MLDCAVPGTVKPDQPVQEEQRPGGSGLGGGVWVYVLVLLSTLEAGIVDECREPAIGIHRQVEVLVDFPTSRE